MPLSKCHSRAHPSTRPFHNSRNLSLSKTFKPWGPVPPPSPPSPLRLVPLLSLLWYCRSPPYEPIWIHYEISINWLRRKPNRWGNLQWHRIPSSGDYIMLFLNRRFIPRKQEKDNERNAKGKTTATNQWGVPDLVYTWISKNLEDESKQQ